MCCPGFGFAASAETVPSYELMSVHNQWVYDYDNGMPAISINSIIQTDDGYIWMASHSGLIRFSGDAFVTFSPETDEAFSTYNIMTLFEDSKGRMWIGTSDGGALFYENHVFNRVQSDNATLSVTDFAEKADGTVLMGTKDGLYALDAEGIAALVDDSHPTEQVMVDDQDRLWTLGTNGEIFLPEDFPLQELPSHRYSAVFQDRRGNILLGTDLGQVVVLEKQGEEDAFSPRVVNTQGLNQINAFCDNAAGDIWICADSGLGQFNSAFSYQKADGARISSSLWSAVVDHEGGIWIASSRSGVLHLMPTVIRDINFAANLGERVTNSAVIHDGYIYAGTDSGLSRIEENHFQPMENELTQLIGDIRVRCLTVDSAGNLWVAAYERYGAVRYGRDGVITVFNKANGLISDKARQVLELSNGSIAVATNEGVNLIEGDQVIASYGQADGLSNTTVLSLTEDAQQRLYIGTDGGGIFVLENSALTPLTIEELDSNVILRMCYDPEGQGLWIATSSSFYYWSDGQLQLMPHIFQGVKAVFDIVPAPDGRWILLATEGIFAGTRDDLLNNTQDLVLIRIKGAQPYHLTANSWNRIDADGNLFLCAAKELGLFNVGYLANNATEAQLIVDSITVDHEAQAFAQEIRMPNTAQRLTISVNSPHFGFEENFTFEYQMEGFDTEKQYLPAGQVNDISYTNLPGGTYTFHISVLNGVGTPGGQASFQIVKEKQLHERVEVWVAGSVLLILLILLIIKLVTMYRTHQLMLKKEEYRRITNQAITIISHAIDAKDEYTEGHSRRVSEYSVEVGSRMGMDEDELEKLRYIALLHDIGKIGIHDDILNKPDRLTDDEFAVMKSHTEIGSNILEGFTAVPNIGEGAFTHHEKFDGTGYPRGLKGDEISLTSRIIGVCDTYDAMATTRAYRKGLTSEIIIAELEKNSGTQFDPKIADVMIQMIREGFTADRPEEEAKHKHVKPVVLRKIKPQELRKKPAEAAEAVKAEAAKGEASKTEVAKTDTEKTE